MVGEPEVVVGAEQQHRLAFQQDRGPLRPADQAQAPAEAESLQLLQARFDLAHR
jgi:hypothetical protein